MDLNGIVQSVAEAVRPHLGEGKVADYIPALACIEPTKFGLAVVTTDGEVVTAGDAHEPFSVQSVSKVFTLTLALDKAGCLFARSVFFAEQPFEIRD